MFNSGIGLLLHRMVILIVKQGRIRRQLKGQSGEQERLGLSVRSFEQEGDL